MDDNYQTDFEEYAQHMEIHIDDMAKQLCILMKNGYVCKVSQDGESMDYVAIEYINPEYCGHTFDEVEY